ncbi:hypothetical protein Q0590_14500 [Rhodocytophaga aerolata]|uniref:Uncharacterized protein n=1 Tax=Rhodocytophaga aerolata TaxID=455078 RepID=A0ABT8R9V5_9BACT|nr:hypothetical protein [Rhodocytophaga aerolata]MDO1447475.1 hypothetical protein [Rhodocytophaga aerolata]
MLQPVFPLILIRSQEGLQVIPTEADLCKATPFGKIRNTDQELVFDKEGNKWTYRLTSPQSKKSLAKKILDYILYNPVIEIKPEWTQRDTYQMQELKELMHQCITRHTGTIPIAARNAIKMGIAKASSFTDLYQSVNQLAF